MLFAEEGEESVGRSAEGRREVRLCVLVEAVEPGNDGSDGGLEGVLFVDDRRGGRRRRVSGVRRGCSREWFWREAICGLMALSSTMTSLRMA